MFSYIYHLPFTIYLFRVSENFTAINPNFNANVAIWHTGPTLGEINIGPQSLQRQTALHNALNSAHLGSVKPSAKSDLHTLYILIGHHLLRSLFEHSAEGGALLNQLLNHMSHNTSVTLGATDLFNYQTHIARHTHLLLAQNFKQILFELGSALPRAANDHTRASSLDEHVHRVLPPLNLYVVHQESSKCFF